MKTKIMFLALFFAVPPLNAGILKWDLPEGRRIEINRTADVLYSENGIARKKYMERNIIDLTCYEKNDEQSRVKGVFAVFRLEHPEGIFEISDRYSVDFAIRGDGTYVVNEKDYMPNLRNIPSFPPGDVEPGDRWISKGELVLNEFSRPFKLIFEVEYLFEKIETASGRRVALIRYDFDIDMNINPGLYPGDFPARIKGHNTGYAEWDLDISQPLNYKDSYYIVFLFKYGAGRFVSRRFDMNINSAVISYPPVSEKEGKDAQAELKKALPEDGTVEAGIDERGLVLRLGSALFDTDSHRLKDRAKTNLEKAVELIKQKYPDREIIIEGHADSTGTEPYNRQLSEKRALSAAEFLKEKLGHDKMSYKGFGTSKPIDTNDTKEGRARNRRVEVIIKLK